MSKTIIVSLIVAGMLGFFAGKYQGRVENQAVTSNDHDHGDETTAASEPVSESFVCPMHAEIVSGEQGSCPICGMDLVKNSNAHSVDEQDDGLPVVEITPVVVHNLGVKTARVEKGDLHRSIETIGKITRLDPTARRIITPPVKGELVYVIEKYNGDIVAAGEKLFSVASPELFEQQQVFQKAYLSGDRASATSMIPQLREMGMTAEQIALLQGGEEPVLTADVYAFEEGYIFSRPTRIEVGQQVHTGSTVFNVGGNYQVVEVTAEIFERQWGWVEAGQTATMNVRGLPGTYFEGKVVRVEPPVGYTTRSLEVALKFKTDHPGISQSMFAHVSILGQAKRNVLTVPSDTVIRTGEGERVVLVRDAGQYQPVAVVAGDEAGGRTEIVSGLEEGDEVVASGQFLIDSESNLLSGFRRMYTPGIKNEALGGHQHHKAGHPDERDRQRAVEEANDKPRIQRLNSYEKVNVITETRS